MKKIPKSAKYLRTRLISSNNFRKREAAKRFSKNITIDKVKLTKVYSINTTKPIENKIGQAYIQFLFIKGERRVSRQGISNKHIFPEEAAQAHNEALAMAVSEIGFSPDRINVISAEYLYFEPVND